jgi:hypothetical protein
MRTRISFLLLLLLSAGCGTNNSALPLDSGSGGDDGSPGNGDAAAESSVEQADAAPSVGDGNEPGQDARSGGVDASCANECGSPEAGGPDAGPDRGDASPFATGDAGGLALYCWQDSEYLIGPLNNSCTTVTDCAIANHVTSCCGAITEYGVNQSAVAEYNAENANCTPPACTCMPGGPYAQDGMTENQSKPIALKCESRTCLTYVP